jgi:hypothetical protein
MVQAGIGIYPAANKYAIIDMNITKTSRMPSNQFIQRFSG